MIRFEAISDILQFIAADLIFQIGSCQFVNATDMIRSTNLLILVFIYMKQRVKSSRWKNCGAEQKKVTSYYRKYALFLKTWQKTALQSQKWFQNVAGRQP